MVGAAVAVALDYYSACAHIAEYFNLYAISNTSLGFFR